MNYHLTESLKMPIRWLVMLGFLSLPYTHFKWMPDLGATRPVSAVFFGLAFGLVVIQALPSNGLSLRAWLRWPKSWDNWPMLRWWVALIGLGILSAAITPFYGLPIQALTRLLGYVAIFITLFIAAYSLPRYGIKTIARWTLTGYVPVLGYAVVEVLAILNVDWALQFIQWFRTEFIISFSWNNRISLMTTEPSFTGFHLLLLMLLASYVTEKWLKYCGWALIVLCLLFTQSGTIFGLVATYFVLWGLFSLGPRILSRLTWATTGIGAVTLLTNWLIPQIQITIFNLAEKFFSIGRLFNMVISMQIRSNYTLNLVYALIETYGLGLGIGQYGFFWKEIYLRHIDYRQFDIFGEVHRALTVPGDYTKPWSVILGIGVDLGLAGLVLLFAFFWQVLRVLAKPRQQAMFFACLFGLFGAYPIVTPHLWLVLALMAGLGLELKQDKITT
jgi:hypothetical protein